MKEKKIVLFSVIFFCIFLNVFSQKKYATIYGKITDEKENPISEVNVFMIGYPSGVASDKNGNYELKIFANKKIKIGFSSIGFENKSILIKAKEGKHLEYNEKLKKEIIEVDGVVITSDKNYIEFERINPKIINFIPSASGDFLVVLKTFEGVSSNNELSSQYSVRGGNFDENLIYVNDIEIYRPMLIRSGQQEGLSFINTDMVSSILFSSGGFDAKYGDKMSSVLDIKYKKPSELEGAVTASMLGGSVFLGDRINNFTYITSFRYKTSQYLLNSLETDGSYQPNFRDFQTYLTYKLNEKLDFDFLFNYSSNSYKFVPEDRNTSFGTMNNALGFRVYFEGQELDEFKTNVSAFSMNYKIIENLNLKFILSTTQTNEKENFDILGQYFLNELDKEIGSDNLGDSTLNLGIGSFLNHARNSFSAKIYNIAHKGYFKKEENFFRWGIKFQKEIIEDKINEWKLLDSAGYSMPFSDEEVFLKESSNEKNNLNTNRISMYFQDTYKFPMDSVFLKLTAGLRANYWDFNNQFIISPRAAITFVPNSKKDILFRFSFGFYHQPAFYKELKNLAGEIQKNIKAQQSVHFVLTFEKNFKFWDRPFKLKTSIYHKILNDIIPYEIDNVRIRYYGENNSKAYITGLDFKINGEFVHGIDSWFSLSLMNAIENISGDNLAYIPMPSDQILNMGLFFQDYIPNNHSYKMHLNLVFATGLPFEPPNIKSYDLRMPSYKRVDIGFSKILKSEIDIFSKKNPFRFIKSIWITAEVFNLLDIKNTVSYDWIKVVPSATNPNPNFPDQFAVPNYLTKRRINLKLRFDF